MKISLDSKGKEKLNSILDKRDLNLEASDFYSLILNDYYDLIDESDFLTDKKDSEYFSLLMNKSEISINTNELLTLINSNKINIFHLLDEKKYLNNPYYRNIPFKNIKYNNFTLTTNYYDKYESFLFDEVNLDSNLEINHVGFFNKQVNYYSLLENDTTWMSITPYEINTMEKSINQASGNILTLGLGLGYYQYMTSNLDKVRSITIVEKNKDVIELFNKHILPYFSNSNKIKIVNEDAISFLSNNLKEYDYVFADIHHDEEEGLLFLLSLINKNIKVKNLHFWIEDSILILARRYLLSIIEEHYHGYNKSNYLNPKTNEEKIISSLFNIYEDEEKKKEKNLIELLDINNIGKKLLII